MTTTKDWSVSVTVTGWQSSNQSVSGIDLLLHKVWSPVHFPLALHEREPEPRNSYPVSQLNLQVWSVVLPVHCIAPFTGECIFSHS